LPSSARNVAACVTPDLPFGMTILPYGATDECQTREAPHGASAPELCVTASVVEGRRLRPHRVSGVFSS
jgi:hypothetical protein